MSIHPSTFALALNWYGVRVEGRRDALPSTTYWDIANVPDFTLFPWFPAGDVAFGLHDINEQCVE